MFSKKKFKFFLNFLILKLSQFLIKYHEMKTYGRMEAELPAYLTSILTASVV